MRLKDLKLPYRARVQDMLETQASSGMGYHDCFLGQVAAMFGETVNRKPRPLIRRAIILHPHFDPGFLVPSFLVVPAFDAPPFFTGVYGGFGRPADGPDSFPLGMNSSSSSSSSILESKTWQHIGESIVTAERCKRGTDGSSRDSGTMRARTLTPLATGMFGVVRVNPSTLESGGCAAVVGTIAGELADDTSEGVLEGHAVSKWRVCASTLR